MAIRTVLTRGYGNGTFNGTIPLVLLRGHVSSVVTQTGGAANWQEQQTAGWTHTADHRPQIRRNTSYGQTIQSNVSQ